MKGDLGPTPKRVIQGAVRAYLARFGPSTVADIASGTNLTQSTCKSACKALGCDSEKFGGWRYGGLNMACHDHRMPVFELWYLPEQAARRPVLCRNVA